MHNTIGDVAMTNTSRENKVFPWFCDVSKTNVLRFSKKDECTRTSLAEIVFVM